MNLSNIQLTPQVHSSMTIITTCIICEVINEEPYSHIIHENFIDYL
ncbi:hypothetical protein NUBL22009_25770 [Klebsiella pneumoniae]|nr:hypothetical protein KP1_0408 [Klebsiella pneumoniae subsp. pneumoniae NTUH-K2044]GJI74493.1 hypothetical protein KP2269_31280 [Klebsiella pneumoniae]GKK85511.1 hypothetical protein NUBL21989_36990 [Klebsiella pneumoniae]GKL64670.1 hypothetical protein NUBL21993_27500 [Klebsiella pneumoniae]GKL70503.1 hypothetical protein NUBL13800_35320 [Klebsiella pneumoniae]